MSDKPLGNSNDDTIPCANAESDLSEDQILDPDALKKILGIGASNTVRRYTNVRTIGLGGIGSVLSAHEPVLNRNVAIKILRPAYRNKMKFLKRFIREARATSQIEHPNIVPIHQLNVFDDLGVYFTMKRVVGKSLRDVLDEMDMGDKNLQQQYSLRQLLQIFISACNGVAFAHSKGFIHRDLKPSNIMLGDFGEVLVMDWGLVKYREENDNNDDEPKANIEANMEGATGNKDPIMTEDGSISGTPAYMAPEQAGGKVDEIDEQTDLYSLGAILYSMLTWKSSPFPESMTTNQVLSHVVNSHFEPPRKRTPARNIPKELEAICLKAMAARKEDRYENVKELINDVRNYRDNYPVNACPIPPLSRFVKMCRRHPLIPSVVLVAAVTIIAIYLALYMVNTTRMNSLMAFADYNISQGNAYYRQAQTACLRLQEETHSDDEQASEKELSSEGDMVKFEAEFNNHYDSAIEFLSQIEGLGMKKKIITEKMADIFKKRLEFSILSGKFEETRRIINKLRVKRRKAFLTIIEKDKDLFNEVKMIVQGEGVINVSTFPSGANIYLRKFLNGHVKKYGKLEFLAKTPYKGEIKQGEYLLFLRLPGRAEVRYPLAVRSAKTETVTVKLPTQIPRGMVYIPAGAFYSGTGIKMSQLRKVNVPGFFISRYEVTFKQYLKFWKSLKSQDQRKLYMAKFDRENREYINVWDAQGKLNPEFKPEMPVVGITGKAAAAYCRWLSKQMGVPCRLPTVLEWEKAARGVDGRTYVWGNVYLPDVSLGLYNIEGRRKFPISAPPGSFRRDVSVYGVYDLGGNVREFVCSRTKGLLIFRIKGGSVSAGPLFARCGFTSYAASSENDIGFRYVIPLKYSGK